MSIRTKFPTKKSYLEAVLKNPEELAFVPISFAAEFVGVKRSTANDLMQARKLVKITVQEEGLKWSGVQIKSLLEYASLAGSDEERARPKVKEILEEHAQKEMTIDYGDLLIEIGMTHRNPQHRKIIGTILGEISEESWDKNKFMLSALAVNKASKKPNESFFVLAEQFGAIEDSSDEEECNEFFDQQLETIFEHYSAGAARSRSGRKVFE